MYVIKRNGEEQELSFAKLKKAISFAIQDPDDLTELMQDIVPNIRHKMTTKEIQRTAIRLALEKTSKERPRWQFHAARLFLYDLYKEASINRGYTGPGYGSFYKLIKDLTSKGLMGSYIRKHYNKKEIDELGKYIQPSRDTLFNYIGLRHVADRYLIRGKDGEVLELPQEMFMGVAMHLAMKEKRKVYWAKRIYDVLSTLKLTVATPTLSNARRPYHQLSSCFIDTVGDDLRQIYYSNSSFANVSKYGGGMGLYIGKVRGRSSDIRGVKNAAAGTIPFIRLYNDTAVAVDQLGVRKGGVAIYQEVSHPDIFDHLNLRSNQGDERMKAHDVFPAVCISDRFMRAVKRDEDWHLFCPHQFKQFMGESLEDRYDEEQEGELAFYSNLYDRAVAHPLLPRKTVKATELFEAILKSAWENGAPFFFFRDTANRMNPNKHVKGVGYTAIYSSNLCTEIFQNMSISEILSEEIVTKRGETYIVTTVKPGDYVVCNLASVVLDRIDLSENSDDLPFVVTTAMRLLDNVIDLNFYPVKQAEVTNKKYRAVGLGLQGYHAMLAKAGIAWESEEHLRISDKVCEDFAYFAIKASSEIAAEKGSYELFEGSEWHTGKYFERRGYTSDRWKALAKSVKENGLRNANLMAIAPTGSTSIIAGSTATTDPVYKKFFIEEKKGLVVPQTAPNLSPKNFWLYKEAYQIDQMWSVMACSVRARHIDQGNSFNLYLNAENYGGENTYRYYDLIMAAWELGLKSIYYTRNESMEVDVEDCSSCSA